MTMLRRNLLRIFLGFLILAAGVVPQASYADWSIGIGVGDRHEDRDHDRWEHDRREHRGDRDFYRWHEHPSWGLHVHFLPYGYYPVWVNGVQYYYYDGLYYANAGYGDYVLVNPPIGAYVTSIPPDFQEIIINGRAYYTDNGVYYILTRHHGYKVVPPPVVYEQAAPVIVSQPAQVVYTQPAAPVAAVEPAGATVGPQDTFPVNVPNNSGGYTSVAIRRSGSGFVGPQGEYYGTFPSVAQLKAMYGK
jgi:hypothetical protein